MLGSKHSIQYEKLCQRRVSKQAMFRAQNQIPMGLTKALADWTNLLVSQNVLLLHLTITQALFSPEVKVRQNIKISFKTENTEKQRVSSDSTA